MLASNRLETFLQESLEPPTVLPATHTVTDASENVAAEAETQGGRRFSLGWEYLAIALVILLIAGIRFRLRDFPLERDEGEYAYAGQLILQGIPPYELAYNMKLPGTYAAYAAIMAIFGHPLPLSHSPARSPSIMVPSVGIKLSVDQPPSLKTKGCSRGKRFKNQTSKAHARLEFLFQ